MEGEQMKTLESPSMVEIPRDVIETKILAKLPIESLPKFKLVCKSFNSIISSPNFLKDSGRLIVLNTTRRGFYTFEFDAPESPSFFIPFPESFNREVHFLGSCNGLLCIVNSAYKLMLLNPLTGMFFNVPCLIREKPVYGQLNVGFGFDDLSQDYKIVRIANNIEKEVMVYSLKANSWNVISSPSTISFELESLRRNDNGALIDNHLLHWIFSRDDTTVILGGGRNNRTARIGCFDLRTEQWVDNVALPADYDENLGYPNRCETLGVFDGRLCVLIPTREDTQLELVDMWVLMEYGVKDSWVKVLGVCNSSVTSTLRMCPLGSHHSTVHGLDPDNEMLLVRGRKHTVPGTERVVLIRYNRKDKKSRLSQVHKVQGFPQNFSDVCICTKSLVFLPGSNQIRKEKRTVQEQNPAT